MDLDLIFEGGGVLGICYVGAYQALMEKGYRVQRCAGTSVGSIMAALIVAGYAPGELFKILRNTDFRMFMEDTSLGRFGKLGKALSVITDKGMYDSEVIEGWMESLLRKKGVAKFGHVMANGGSRLKVVAADITRRKMLILPDDLSDYGIDPMNFSIARAIRMSCAIPVFYTPVTIETKPIKNFIVDGGLLSNFPIWIFDMEEKYTRPTFGIKIKDQESYTSRGKTGIISYLKDLIYAPLNEDEENFIRNKDLLRTIVINCDIKINFTDFDKVNRFIKDLYDSGYKCAIRYINGLRSKI